MEIVRYNKIALILVLLIGFFIFMHSPFVVSIYVPFIIRIPLFLFIVFFSLLTVIKKKYFVRVYLPIMVFLVFAFVYWVSVGAILAEIIYSVLYFFLAIVLLVSVKRNRSLRRLLVNFYFILIVVLSVLSIISFLAFNLGLAPYVLKPVGEGLDVYMYWHNYFLGYINPKIFESGVIGRVCGFLIEPSYQGWFLSTNYFLISKFMKNKSYVFFIQLIVLLGALSSVSTMSWIVFSIAFASMLGFKIMSIFGLKEKTANILYGIMLSVGIALMFTVVNTDELLESLGPSSSDDRTERADTSFLYLVMASPKELFLGRGPGFIGKNNDRGESNPIIKSLVENGILTTILVLVFIIYCTYRSKYYMITTLLWLNSVVILFTPLFIINVLVCRWMDEGIDLNLKKYE
ncbi:hypothetical protein SD960_04135 [Flavobacterium sp. MMLR14_040]|uniref:hypothetical protein n=1 Tax=Flavobacterium sp. MMLR14_040 TaxID=3093843 RepID=UPI00298F4E8D|nr:hypothetical protein [Flavobacterium sp. MMLR14_040]MDW8849269.1 hypothetical protein [Flavobacterium sp. MMLR14_040]